MATVILARHGRTAANTGGVLAGRTKGVHLDETGIAQAEAAARAARRAAAGRGGDQPAGAVPGDREADGPRACEPSSDRRLLECDYGEWTGQEIKRLAKEKLWRTVQAQPSGARFPGGESLQEMSARVVAAVRARDADVEEETGDHAVWLAVSHGDPIKAILADALGMHLDAFQRIVVDPGSLSVVRYTPHRAVRADDELRRRVRWPTSRASPASGVPAPATPSSAAVPDPRLPTRHPLGSAPCRSSTASTRPSASCRARSASPDSAPSSSRRAPGSQVTSVALEKQQVQILGERVGRAARRADPDRGRRRPPSRR